jgi:hypothetical protein
MADFTTPDGKIVSSGKTYTLTLFKGVDKPFTRPDGTVQEHGDYSERKVKGLVAAYEHVDRVFDDEGYAVDKIITVVWEISQDDQEHPAIGFLPENVLTRTGS